MEGERIKVVTFGKKKKGGRERRGKVRGGRQSRRREDM